jgi:hypothetical protein
MQRLPPERPIRRDGAPFRDPRRPLAIAIGFFALGVRQPHPFEDPIVVKPAQGTRILISTAYWRSVLGAMHRPMPPTRAAG